MLRNIIFILLAFYGSFVCAQKGKIVGKVYDYRGEPVAYCIVLLLQGEEIKNGTTTDDSGEYVIQPVEVGVYTLKTNFAGEEKCQESINIWEGDSIRIDLEIDLAGDDFITSGGPVETVMSDSFLLSRGLPDIQNFPRIKWHYFFDKYIVTGAIRGNLDLPSNNRLMHVITSGTPAEFGDFTKEIYLLDSGDEWWFASKR